LESERKKKNELETIIKNSPTPQQYQEIKAKLSVFEVRTKNIHSQQIKKDLSIRFFFFLLFKKKLLLSFIFDFFFSSSLSTRET
jgi:hypothetical protein